MSLANASLLQIFYERDHKRLKISGISNSVLFLLSMQKVAQSKCLSDKAKALAGLRAFTE